MFLQQETHDAQFLNSQEKELGADKHTNVSR